MSNGVTDLGTALKALALLVHYPSQEAVASADAIGEALEGRDELTTEDQEVLAGFLEQLRTKDLLDQEAEYVATFDSGKQVSLHLFEHIHGESRDRGPAMVELRMAYRERGLELDANELPDYLPLVLEFCAQLPEPAAQEWLADIGHILQRIHVRLDQRDDRYALPLRLLLRLAAVDPWPAELLVEAQEERRDDTREAIDNAWDEAPVSFGAGDALASCGVAAGGAGTNPAGQGPGHV